MDGDYSVMLVSSETATKGSVRATFNANWLLRLADVGDIIAKDLVIRASDLFPISCFGFL